MKIRAFVFAALMVSGLASADQLILNWKPEAEFGGFYEADRAGFYKAEGLSVQVVPGGVGTPAIQMVASGKAEFGIAAADEVILSRARGTDVVGIFAVYQTNPQGILAHSAREAKSIQDLMSSGTLAFQKGLSSFAFLEKKYGPAKAKVVPYIGNVSQMAKDPNVAVQCYVTSEPISAAKLGLKTKSFLIADAGFNPYSSLVIVRRSLIEKDRERVEKFLRATTKGWAQYLKDPSAANAVMNKLNPSMDLETLKESAKIQIPLIETTETKALGLGAMTAKRWKDLSGQLVEIKAVEKDKVLPAEGYFWWPKKQ